MLKRIKLVILVFLVILLCGCGVGSVKVNNPLTENEIINYVQNEIYRETGDETRVSIINKEKLSVCTAWLDGCVRYQTVEGGHWYEVEIINKSNNEIIGKGKYRDGYIKYDKQYTNGKSESAHSFTSNYKEQKGLFLIKNEFINALNEKFNKYHIYNDVSNDTGYDIFINSSNYDDINDLLLKFKNTVIKYRDIAYTSYSVYIYKDENVFNNTNFDLYKNGHEYYGGQSYGKDMIEQYTGKEVIRIGGGKDFNYELFTSNGASAANTNDEYIDYNTFEYLVFWYNAEPNSFVGYNTPSMQIFGVK